MKLIENKSINGSAKIIKLKEKEVQGKARQLLNHYKEGGIIVIEGFKPENVNYSVLQRYTQEPCSYNWDDRSIKKCTPKNFLRSAILRQKLRQIYWLTREVFGGQSMEYSTACCHIRACTTQTCLFKAFGDVSLLLMKIITLTYIQIPTLEHIGTWTMRLEFGDLGIAH